MLRISNDDSSTAQPERVILHEFATRDALLGSPVPQRTRARDRISLHE